jgi:hypothetical protein
MRWSAYVLWQRKVKLRAAISLRASCDVTAICDACRMGTRAAAYTLHGLRNDQFRSLPFPIVALIM